MKNKILFTISFILICFALIFNDSSNSSAEVNVNAIIVHVTYADCGDFTWDVDVTKNGGGFSGSCQIIPPGSCKCPVSGPPAGYYTITVDNGSCTGTLLNVYHSGTGYTDVYVSVGLDCYR